MWGGEERGKRRKKSSVHQGMGKPDFGTVDGAISGGFEDGEIICVFGVEEEGVDCILFSEPPGGRGRRSVSQLH